MPSRSGSDDQTQPIDIRRPVEIPVTDVAAVEDFAPAFGSTVADETAPAFASTPAQERTSAPTFEEEQAATSSSASVEEVKAEAAGTASEREDEQFIFADRDITDSDVTGSAAAEYGAGEATEPAASADEGGEPAADGQTAPEEGEKEKAGRRKRSMWLRNVAVAPASPDGVAAVDEEMPPDRPRKPVLAGVAIGGAVLLAVPVLLIGTGHHHGRKHRTVAAADTVLPGDARQPPPGAYVPASPPVSPSPTASARKTTRKPGTKSSAAGHALAGSAGDGFKGVANVLLKNVVGGACADVPGYDNGWAGLQLQTGHCTLGDTDNQVWSLSVAAGLKGPGGDALFTIRNTKTGACMAPHGTGAGKSGTAVDQDYCKPTKGDNQLWYLTHVRGRLYEIRNAASHGLCLGVGGRSGGVDKPLEIHTCGSSDEWSWSSGE